MSPTGDASPIPLPPYRLAHSTQDFLREEIKALWQQGIIEPSRSPWATPVVIVPKKDWNKRMCVDFSKLNAITVDDQYSLSHVEDLINDKGMAKYTTILDLTQDITRSLSHNTAEKIWRLSQHTESNSIRQCLLGWYQLC